MNVHIVKTYLSMNEYRDLSQWITEPLMCETNIHNLNYNQYFIRMAKAFQTNLNKNHEDTNNRG